MKRKIWRGPKNKKTSPEMIEEMKELRNQGWTYQKIADELNLSNSTIQYHLKEKTRQLVKERQRRAWREGRTWDQNKPGYRKEYMRNYMRERYNADPEFRERMKKHVRISQNRNRSSKESAKNE